MPTPHAPSITKTDQADCLPEDKRLLRRGLMLGMMSAIGYSAANLALRGLSGRDDGLPWAIWVTAMKAYPTVIVAAFLLIRRRAKKLTLYPTYKPIPALFLAALVMQFGGNLGFQISLVHIGLAITVPIVFAFIISSGAILGRLFLGDGVGPRTVLSMVIMTVSVILLSYAATLNKPESTQTGVIWFGVLMAVVSGLSYGINGAVIRGVSRNTLPVESMLIIYSSTGLVCLSSLGIALLGPTRILEIHADEWILMMLAGTFNAIAFFSISNALKLLNISHVNVMNAAQNGICAIAAVAIFSEPVSTAMVVGILLSVCGIIVLDRK